MSFLWDNSPPPPPANALVFNDLWISLHVYKAYLSLRYKGIYKNLPTIFFLTMRVINTQYTQFCNNR